MAQSWYFLFVLSFLSVSYVLGQADLPPPVWPFEFNTTLAKVNPVTSHIWWTKLYYDYNSAVARFDFFNGYYGTSDDWGGLNCSIYFTNNSWVWMTFADLGGCYLDHTDVPVMSPYWLEGAAYNGTTLFRGVYANLWSLSTDLGDIAYYARADDNTPMRSTNQNNDPGATDYFDFVIGPQDPSLFVLPSYCSNLISAGCPPF